MGGGCPSFFMGAGPHPHAPCDAAIAALGARADALGLGMSQSVLRFGAEMPVRIKVAAKSATEQVRAYIAALPPDARRHLQKLRQTIRSAAPRATEHFSYRIPGFRLDGKALIWYAAWKTHCSMYPIGDAVRRAFAKELGGFKTSKGTVQFPYTDMPSAALVKRLVKARVAQVRKAG